MGKISGHLLKAEHNRDFVDIIPAAYRDWQIDALFYSAIHLAHAVLHLNGYASDILTTHNKVTAVVNAVFPDTEADAYCNLLSLSRQCRYDTFLNTSHKMFDSALGYYNRVLDYCRQELQEKCNADLLAKISVRKIFQDVSSKSIEAKTTSMFSE